MIEFEPRARLAAMADVADERATAAIASPDFALDRGGDVSSSRLRTPRWSRPVGRPEPGAFELRDLDAECLAEEFREAPRRDFMPEQRLGSSKQLEGLLVRRELDGVRLGCKWRDACAWLSLLGDL